MRARARARVCVCVCLFSKDKEMHYKVGTSSKWFTVQHVSSLTGLDQDALHIPSVYFILWNYNLYATTFHLVLHTHLYTYF